MRLFSLVLMIFLIPDLAWTQYRITSVPVLTEPLNTRHYSTGNAMVSFVNSSGGNYINPATLEHNGLPTINYFLDTFGTNHDVIEVRLQNFYSGASFGNFDIALSYLDLRSSFSEEAIVLSEPYRDNVIKITGAYIFKNGLRAGIGLNYLKSDIRNDQIYVDREYNPAKSVFFDLGIQYHKTYYYKDETWLLTPSYGLSLTNFGKAVSYYEGISDPLPTKLRLGTGLSVKYGQESFGLRPLEMNGSLAVSKFMVRNEMEIIENNGSTDTVYVAMNPFKALFRSWGNYKWSDGLDEQTATIGDQLIFHTGFEVIFYETLSLRFGYQKASEVNLPYTFQAGGFGINLGYLSFDYSKYFYPEGRINDKGSTWNLTARIPLDGKKPRSILNHIFN